MARVVLRVLQVTFGAVGGLLIVPVAVNVGTGGTPPGWLRPHVGLLWPAAVTCVGLVIALELCDKLVVGRTAMSVRRPNDRRNVELALIQVKRYVEQRLTGSLAERVRVALALDERPAAVRQPAHVVRRVGGQEFQLAPGLGVVDVFDQMDGLMLVLGAPGAGKTTLLLDLAADLATRARSGDGVRVPVVVDLADWSRSRRRRWGLFRPRGGAPREFAGWLLATLRERYHIPEPVGRHWLGEDRLTLLLDGLDEVRDIDRERCVAEIDALQSRYGVTQLVVCSRTAPYAALSSRLALQGAVAIRPLTREQVVAYFAEVSPRLAGVTGSLREDPELWEILTSPLMLNIMALAYGDRAAGTVGTGGSRAERRRRLFDAYVVEVFARRRPHERLDAEAVLRAVRALALASANLDAGVSVVRLNVRTKSKAVEHAVLAVGTSWLIPVAGTVCSVIFGAATGARFGLLAGLVTTLVLWVPGWLVYLSQSPRTVRPPRPAPLAAAAAVMVAYAVALLLGPGWLAVRLVGQPHIAVAAAALALGLLDGALMYVYARTSTSDSDIRWVLTAVATAGGVLTAAGTFVSGASARALAATALGFGAALCWLTLVLGFSGFDPGQRDDGPVQRSRTRRGWYSAGSLLLVLAGTLAFGAGRPDGFWAPATGWMIGVGYGFWPGLVVADSLTGPLSWMVAAVAGEPFPWSRRVLRSAVDRGLLVLVDGEHRFLHLLVRDHLAGCDPRELAAGVARRRAELVAAPEPAAA